MLLDDGVPVNARDAQGSTALIEAAKGGHVYTVRELLARGADPNLKPRGGKSAAAWAKEYRNSELDRLLRDAKRKPKR
jgi:ankyrin repeat protein